jgi:hypothetical protein
MAHHGEEPFVHRRREAVIAALAHVAWEREGVPEQA